MENKTISTGNISNDTKIAVNIAKSLATAVIAFFSLVGWLFIYMIMDVNLRLRHSSWSFLSTVIPIVFLVAINLLVNNLLWIKKSKARLIITIVCVLLLAVCIAISIVLSLTTNTREYVMWM